MEVRDLSEYVGEYVALANDDDNAEVVAHGDRIHHVNEEAIARGCENPVVTFVPPADMICSY